MHACFEELLPAAEGDLLAWMASVGIRRAVLSSIEGFGGRKKWGLHSGRFRRNSAHERLEAACAAERLASLIGLLDQTVPAETGWDLCLHADAYAFGGRLLVGSSIHSAKIQRLEEKAMDLRRIGAAWDAASRALADGVHLAEVRARGVREAWLGVAWRGWTEEFQLASRFVGAKGPRRRSLEVGMIGFFEARAAKDVAELASWMSARRTRRAVLRPNLESGTWRLTALAPMAGSAHERLEGECALRRLEPFLSALDASIPAGRAADLESAIELLVVEGGLRVKPSLLSCHLDFWERRETTPERFGAALDGMARAFAQSPAPDSPHADRPQHIAWLSVVSKTPLEDGFPIASRRLHPDAARIDAIAQAAAFCSFLRVEPLDFTLRFDAPAEESPFEDLRRLLSAAATA